MKVLSLILFVLNYNLVINGQLQCRDETGKIVDWYVVYKFPRLTSHSAPLDTGYRYAFITNNTKNGFTLSDYDINDEKKSIFGQTLSPLYSTKLSSQISYINYNDQPPEGEALSGGAHAKGVVAADETHAFWLIHSVPHFASEESTHKYVYPTTGARYGQTALCISLKTSEMSKVVAQLLVMQPHIYSKKISETLRSKVTQIKALEDKDWAVDKSSIKYLTSIGGMNFTTFSKSPDDHVDLYSGIVSKSLKTSLYVETWRKNPGNPLDSYCNKPTVENVDEIDFKFQNSKLTGKFSYLDDHSKWAISTNEALPYVCIGDINRVESQYKRGGGTTCLQTPQVWKYMDEWTAYIDECK